MEFDTKVMHDTAAPRNIAKDPVLEYLVIY